MIARSLPLVLSLCLLLVTAAAAQDSTPAAPPEAPAGTYVLDTAHTTIGFKVTHLGISEVHGRFNEFSGEVTLGEQPAFNATIQTASVDTGVERRDNHLRSGDFFSADQHPQITFKSKGVEVDGDTHKVTGDFTMHGQTKEIVLPLKYFGSTEFRGKQRVGFVGEVTIDRREWGLEAWQGMVGNDVTLIISFEAEQQ